MPKIDLSSVLKPPKVVTIRGKDYRLPGDIPIELVALMDTDVPEDDEQAAQRRGQQVIDEIDALFRVYQPDLERLPLGMEEAVEALGVIYAAEVEQDGDGADPTPERAPGTPTSKRAKTKSTSTSSTS